jgi:putative transposase
MKRRRFTEEQIIAVLGEHEAGARTADLAQNRPIADLDAPRSELR